MFALSTERLRHVKTGNYASRAPRPNKSEPKRRNRNKRRRIDCVARFFARENIQIARSAWESSGKETAKQAAASEHTAKKIIRKNYSHGFGGRAAAPFAR